MNNKWQYLTASVMFYLASNTVLAHSFSLNYGRSPQQASLLDVEQTIMLAGWSPSLSFDVNDNFSVLINYQQLDTQENFSQHLDIAQEDSLKSVTFDYYLSQRWGVSASLSKSDSVRDFNISRQQRTVRNEQQQTTSYQLTLSYSQQFNHWFAHSSIGLSVDNWQQDTRTVQLNKPEQTERISGHGKALQLQASVGYLKLLDQQQSITLGMGFSWFNQLSGEQNFIARNGHQLTDFNARQQQRILDRLVRSGHFSPQPNEDSYTLINIFASFSFNDALSIDSSVNYAIATDVNQPSLNIGVSYWF